MEQDKYNELKELMLELYCKYRDYSVQSKDNHFVCYCCGQDFWDKDIKHKENCEVGKMPERY